MDEPLPHRSAPATGVAHTLHRDYETRSNADLPKVGVDKYAADPSTEGLCAAYAVDDGPVQVWLPGREPIPAAFIEAERDPSWVVSAHNDAFETAIERHISAPRFGFPFVPLERHRCTMARCQAAALPAKLETVADVLELEHRKDADGAQLIENVDFVHGWKLVLLDLGRFADRGAVAILLGGLNLGIDFQGARAVHRGQHRPQLQRQGCYAPPCPAVLARDAVITTLGQDGYEIRTPVVSGQESKPGSRTPQLSEPQGVRLASRPSARPSASR